MITAETDGWATLKEHVAKRDGGCISRKPEVFGKDVSQDTCLGVLEFDHVKENLRSGLRATNDEAHGVAVCSWHHRGSRWRSDTKDRRKAIRGYLALLYPEVWDART